MNLNGNGQVFGHSSHGLPSTKGALPITPAKPNASFKCLQVAAGSRCLRLSEASSCHAAEKAATSSAAAVAFREEVLGVAFCLYLFWPLSQKNFQELLRLGQVALV